MVKKTEIIIPIAIFSLLFIFVRIAMNSQSIDRKNEGGPPQPLQKSAKIFSQQKGREKKTTNTNTETHGKTKHKKPMTKNVLFTTLKSIMARDFGRENALEEFLISLAPQDYPKVADFFLAHLEQDKNMNLLSIFSQTWANKDGLAAVQFIETLPNGVSVRKTALKEAFQAWLTTDKEAVNAFIQGRALNPLPGFYDISIAYTQAYATVDLKNAKIWLTKDWRPLRKQLSTLDEHNLKNLENNIVHAIANQTKDDELHDTAAWLSGLHTAKFETERGIKSIASRFSHSDPTNALNWAFNTLPTEGKRYAMPGVIGSAAIVAPLLTATYIDSIIDSEKISESDKKTLMHHFSESTLNEFGLVWLKENIDLFHTESAQSIIRDRIEKETLNHPMVNMQ